MNTATCKFWDINRGFGMLESPDEPDIFVHARQVNRVGYASLEPGQVVQYEIGSNPRNGRDMAINLELQDPIVSTPLQPNLVEEDRRAIAEMAFLRAGGE